MTRADLFRLFAVGPLAALLGTKRARPAAKAKRTRRRKRGPKVITIEIDGFDPGNPRHVELLRRGTEHAKAAYAWSDLGRVVRRRPHPKA